MITVRNELVIPLITDPITSFIELPTAGHSGIYLYCEYVEGVEAVIEFKVSVRDDKDLDTGYFPLYTIDQSSNSLIEAGYRLPTSGVVGTVKRFLLPIPVPESADYVRVDMNMLDINGIPVLAGEGTISIYFRSDTVYA